MQKDALNKGNLPQNHNLLKHKGFLYLLAAFFLVKIGFSLLSPNQNLTLASDLSPESILNAVNEQRSLRNLVTLNTNLRLTFAAQSKSDDMQARHYFAHIDPDGHYIWDKIVAAGYSPYLQLGENLAIEFYDTQSLVSAWMNSPTHRANLLQEGFKDQGMGLTFGDTAQGQYHSAIANTFGALALAPAPKIPAAAIKQPAKPAQKAVPKNKRAVKTNPKTLGEQAAAPSPAPEAAPVPANNAPIVTPREPIAPAAEDSSSFALSQKAQTKTASSSPAAIPPKTASSPAVIGSRETAIFNSYQVNRYLILICGIALLLLMIFNFRKAAENKLGSLDKKANNFVLLLLSVVVVAFMYWL